MCDRTDEGIERATHALHQRYAVIIREQMSKQGLSVYALANEGVIPKHRRNDFFPRLREGKLSMGEFQRVLLRLNIDPVRAALSLLCDEVSGSYEDPCCETISLVATSLAKHLPGEMATCEGEFSSLRAGLCESIAQRTSATIARHHAQMERRQNGDGFEHAYG